MHRIRYSLALSRFAKPAFCAVLISLFAFAAHAEESGSVVVTGGGTVEYKNASEVKWVHDEETGNDDLVLIYSNANVTGASFTLPEDYKTKARIFAVGGGGGGGGSAQAAGAHDGGGGGGGAGGVVETNELLSAGTYEVTVGAGGGGGLRTANSKPWEGTIDHRGTNGNATVVSGPILLSAPGGGGGGGESVGKSGASGGGGSMLRTASAAHEARLGGDGIDGIGYKGGAGDTDRHGGGGGGAGGAGSDASDGGAGGVGVTNNITGAWVWYAGGGGGGNCVANSTISSVGGAGGGGAGGAGNGTTEVKPVAGVDGLGGGGGGGSRATGGARGGCGTVIVRISATLGADLIKPPSLIEKVFNNEEQTSISNTAYYTVSGDNVGMHVGEYVATATLRPGYGYKWLDEDGHELDDNPAVVTMRITKVSVSFSNLYIRDWMYGTPPEATPNPKCSPNPGWVEQKYEYADSRDAAEWSSAKPTEVGTHWVRVRPPNDTDYDYDIDDPNHYASFEIFNGHGDMFTDYVKITIEGRSGDALEEFPYEVTLSEKKSQNGKSYPEGTAYAASDLVGFLYSRAGNTGEDIAFTDMDGNFLPYKVKEWNVDGESKVHVKLSQIGTEPQTIMLYWHLRDGQVAPDHDPDSVFSDWTEEAAAAAGQPDCAFGLVNRDNKDVNYFTQLPTIDKTSWNEGDAPGAITDAALAEGSVSMVFLNSLGVELPGMPTTPGVYCAAFSPDDPDGECEELVYNINFSIIGGDTATSDLSGGLTGDFALTVNGRVMLANDDDLDGYKVRGQAWWRTSDDSPEAFWEHSIENRDDDAASTAFDNMTTHTLNVDVGGSMHVLWRMYNVSIGNAFRSDKDHKGELLSNRCALHWSQTSRGSTSDAESKKGVNTESANVILRNMEGAVVYSPCYTNGIGTIYFDALNHNAVGMGGYEASHHRIVVEVATATDDGLEPTDENAGWSGNSPQNITNWRPVEMLPLKRDGGTDVFVKEGATNELALGITTAGDSNNFYRVCVTNIEERGAVRFRIRRKSRVPASVAGFDNGGLILLDNIIVSYPSCTADMGPLGKYDPSRGGAQTLGQECEMANVPFPSVADAETLVGRGSITNYVSAGAAGADAASFVKSAKMFYRWRYLNQRLLPGDGSWRVLDMSPFGGRRDGIYTTTGTLSVTNEPGDIEFKYVLETYMPYYKYTDYSGLGIDLGGLYTEEKSVVTNRIKTTSGKRLPTCGADWFVRMREGASDWEGVDVVLSGGGFGEGGSVAMELVSDNTWRGMAKVPSGASGSASFRFRGVNRQKAGAETFDENSTTWFPKDSLDKLPGRGEAAEGGGAGTFPADTASRYLEFMFNDKTLVYSVGHAEYQDFNAWHDAHRPDGKFVGNYAETSGVSSATMTRTNANIGAWTPLIAHATNGDWNAEFDLYPNYDNPAFPKNVFFGGHDMPGYAWHGESGMFVDAELVTFGIDPDDSHNKYSGIAWQMKGNGAGCVYYAKSSGPSGLDKVTFKAHMAQSISFGDFSYWHGTGFDTTNNYTLVVPALLSRSTTMSGSRIQDYDFAPGASMSVVGYYTPWKGCYEARVERDSTDGIFIRIYKWRQGRYAMESECLVSHGFPGATFEQSGGSATPRMYAILLSLGEDDAGKTTVIAGLTTQASDPSADYSGSGDGVYNIVCFQDGSDTRHTSGSYGVLSSNCDGRFYVPRQRGQRIQKSALAGSGELAELYVDKQVTTTVGSYDANTCKNRLFGEWYYPSTRAERFESAAYGGTSSYVGIRPPSDFVQTIGVYLRERGKDDADWTLAGEIEVPGYGFNTWTADVHTNTDCDVKLATGDLPVDVTVWKIAQMGWRGEDIENIGNKTYDFVYTQANVADIGTEGGGTTNRYAVLQPTRALPKNALSVRSPLLTNGLGMVSFSYATSLLREGCEVWIQAATNAVRGNLSGDTGYNVRTNEVAMGEDEPFGSWTTLRKCSYEELTNANGQISYYCGWHSDKAKPLEGVFRIALSPDVVTAARSRSLSDPEWGMIAITGMEVHDEPPLDADSWIGWNLRTVGDASDGERRMFLPDIMLDGTATGLSSGLNNSKTADVAGDPSEYDKVNPAIQAPTFGGNTSIGQVRFRARLYETNAVIAPPANKATVTLYGSSDGSGGGWSALTNYTVESTVYRIFEYSSVGSKYKAVKFEISGVTGGTYEGGRLLIDEIVVAERPTSTLSFVYARPFRTDLNASSEIANILSPDQQPLSGESWGVQARIKYDTLGGDIDASKGFKVFVRFFSGANPWGYEGGWDDEPAASEWAELAQVGDSSDLVFRSIASRPATVFSTMDSSSLVVQYMLKARYWLVGDDEAKEEPIEPSSIEGEGWTNPAWYWPVDYNADSQYGKGTAFSPYTILDPVSPRRVWINEVNYNDGPKSQSGGSATNQFIELAVPWGVDLKGWKLMLTGMNHAQEGYEPVKLAVLGAGSIPSKKESTDGRRVGDYDFFVLQSPATRDAGGIKDPVTGDKVADGTWSASSQNTTENGTFKYGEPYQIELLRPSGIVEHQIVVAGTNEWRTPPAYFDAFGYKREGTNLVNELEAIDFSPKRFFAGEDFARKDDGTTYSSIGVVGKAHGEDGGWSNDMKFTPGRINEWQSEDAFSGWYLPPIGTAVWLYAKSTTPHIRQRVGDDYSQDILMIVAVGTSTNITYEIDPWYAIGSLTENDVEKPGAVGRTVAYTNYISNITQTTHVVVSEGYDPRLMDAGFDPSDRYAPAILNWLSARLADGTLKNPDGPVTNGWHKGLDDGAPAYPMDLKTMYWFDLDPTDPGWWLRHGIIDSCGGTPVYRKRKWNKNYYEPLTNRQIRVKMYLSNDTDRAEAEVYAPYRLQGLANEQSDDFHGVWTGVTYKVLGSPSISGKFLPVREFVFDGGSFSNGTAGANAYTSLIEILDPFAASSVGKYYGWHYNPTPPGFFFRAVLSDALSTWTSAETLKADSSLPSPPYEPWDGISE